MTMATGTLLVGAIPRPTDRLIIISGQSLAVAAGAVEPTPLPTPYLQHVGTDASTWPADLHLQGWTYLTRITGSHRGCEFGISEMARVDGYRVTVLKFAVNGSGLRPTAFPSWPKGAAPASFYPTWLSFVQTAQVFCGRKLDAVIWWQGEHDANDLVEVNNYAARLNQLHIDWRTDLALPNLPVVAVKMKVDSGVADAVTLRAQQEVWVAAASNRYLMRDNEDLPFSDTVHLTGAGYYTAGTRIWPILKTAWGLP